MSWLFFQTKSEEQVSSQEEKELKEEALEEKTSESEKASENETPSENENNLSDTEKKEKRKKKGCTNDEVLAVLCHELGHWFHNHVFKQLVLTQVATFFFCIVLLKQLSGLCCDTVE